MSGSDGASSEPAGTRTRHYAREQLAVLLPDTVCRWVRRACARGAGMVRRPWSYMLRRTIVVEVYGRRHAHRTHRVRKLAVELDPWFQGGGNIEVRAVAAAQHRHVDGDSCGDEIKVKG